MDAGEKRLNEMNRLSDMLHFPAIVNAGATVNVLVTMFVTWRFVEPAAPRFAGLWVAVVLVLNLLPVALLRLTITPQTQYRRLKEMDFFRDQHKFSDWVYVAASADMAFWILLIWTVAAFDPPQYAYYLWMLLAALVTFSPVLWRIVRPRP